VVVLPDQVFGEALSEPIIWQRENPSDRLFRTQGTIEDWRVTIGGPCGGNSRLILAVSVGFTPPFLDLTGEESGGFHLLGKSSIGKTTALLAAGSIWGGGGVNGFLRQ
jgi:putative DNA primase/helicase